MQAEVNFSKGESHQAKELSLKLVVPGDPYHYTTTLASFLA